MKARTSVGVLIWLIVGLVTGATKADFVRVAPDGKRIYGQVVREEAEQIEFQSRDATGRVRVQVFQRDRVLEVVRTVDVEVVTAPDRYESDFLFEYCEQLASFERDHEARWQFRQLMDYLEKQELAPELRNALQRLRRRHLDWGVLRLRNSSKQLLSGSLPRPADWQRHLVRQLSREERIQLTKVLQHRRRTQEWASHWQELQPRLSSLIHPDALIRLNDLLINDRPSDRFTLLRLELCLENPDQDAGFSSWPEPANPADESAGKEQ